MHFAFLETVSITLKMPNSLDVMRKVLGESFNGETCDICMNKCLNNNNNIVSKSDYYPPVMNRRSLVMPSTPHISARESYMIQRVKESVPRLSQALTKGQCGRIGIIGGCHNTYTGSAYFSAISALKCGADIVHIFCEKEAGPVLRQYSPELIIHPSLEQEYGMVELEKWLPRLDCVVLGPGLGRSQQMIGTISMILEKIKILQLPVVIDGDGIEHVRLSPGVLQGYTRAVITPNTEELSSLAQSLLDNHQANQDLEKEIPQVLEEVCRSLGYLTIVHKGCSDLVSDGHTIETCEVGGSPRRCGGQGDILSGILATLLHWSYTSHQPGQPVTAGWGACRILRAAAQEAYNTMGRATTASDIVNHIHPQFYKLFESETFC